MKPLVEASKHSILYIIDISFVNVSLKIINVHQKLLKHIQFKRIVY